MFKAEKSALAAALASIKNAVNNRNTMPILANVLIEREGSDLLLTGTNLDLQLTARCAATFEDGFTPFTLPNELLTNAIKAMPDGSVSIANATPGARLDAAALKSGRARIKIPILPAGDFPKLKPGAMTHTIGMGSASLRKCIEAVNFAISTEETRYYLNGIFVHATEDGLMFVATDGHRLARRLMPAIDIDDLLEELPHTIIPRDAVDALLKCLPDGENVTLKLSTERMELSGETVSMISKLVEGTFPDYKRTIPVDNNKIVRVGTKALTSALDRVLTVITEKSSGIVFDFREGTLTLTSKPGNHSEASDELSTDGDADFSVGFNGRYMKEILRALGSDDVEIALSNPGSPAILRKPGEKISLSILMPMRIGAAA